MQSNRCKIAECSAAFSQKFVLRAGMGQHPESGGAAVLPGGSGPDRATLQLHSAQRDLAHAVCAGPATHHLHARLPHLLP